MSSVVGEGSVTLNHGGELKVQQELVGPHPCPSHRGSPFEKKGPLSPGYCVRPDSQNLSRVGEGEGGVGSLGTSWLS